MNSQPQSPAGGNVVSVTYEDGRTEQLTVRYFKLKDYQKAFELLGNEIAFMAFACNKTLNEFQALTPESYEAAQVMVSKINQETFYKWAERQKARNMEVLNELPLELLEKTLQKSAMVARPGYIPPPMA